MKLAILGTDPDILQLAAAARDLHHELVWLGDVRQDDAAAVGQLTAGLVDRSHEWELLLDHMIADAVLVGHGAASGDLRAEQLKRLAAEALPMLVVHPAFESVLPCYEVDMVRRETGAVVQHYNPLVGHPVLADLAGWVRDGHPSLGPIHQLTCDRPVAGAQRFVVCAHLARDVELLAAVAGDIRRVSAIGPATLDASFASLQVQMTSNNLASLRWSVGPTATNTPGLQLTLLGELGTVSLRERNDAARDSSPWQIEISSGGQQVSSRLDAFDPAQTAISRLAKAVAETNAQRRAATTTWDAATRAMEVVDAVELSLQKGRTIEVFQQQLTEQLAFRGTMAALGCGLLLIVFAATILVAMLGGAEGMLRQRLAPSWPLLLLAVLAFFLLLQAVPLLARKANRDGGASPAARPDDS